MGQGMGQAMMSGGGGPGGAGANPGLALLLQSLTGQSKLPAQAAMPGMPGGAAVPPPSPAPLVPQGIPNLKYNPQFGRQNVPPPTPAAPVAPPAPDDTPQRKFQDNPATLTPEEILRLKQGQLPGMGIGGQ